MTMYKNLTTVCAAVVLAFGLAACGGGDDDDTAEAPMVEEPMEPAPPAGPTDLEETQTAAAAAATAAMTASTNAAAMASSAADATATLATLQTGADSNAAEMGGNEHAYAAHSAAKDAADAAAAAAAASAAAAAATTGDAGEAAWRMAVAAREDAEAAMALASTHAEAAIAAAMTELHIADTIKWAGGLTADAEGASSVDAAMGMLTTTAADGSATITGHSGDLTRTGGAVVGVAHSAPGVSPVVPYKQAVAARTLKIGKIVDTTDDKARVVVMHSRVGSKSVGVYLDYGAAGATGQDDFIVRTDADGRSYVVATVDTAVPDTIPGPRVLTSIGTLYEATDTASNADTMIVEVEDELDASDVVTVGPTTKGKEVFSYLDLGADNQVGGTDTNADSTKYVIVQETASVVGGNTHTTFQHVDITAAAAPDSPDGDGNLQQVQVKASIPMAVEYSHIHFGVWAGLGEAEKNGTQKVADLGIGFVQALEIGDGMTERLGIGTATYKGDWVGVIQRRNSAGAGAFTIQSGPAEMTADFDKDEFEADLTDLAMLEGTLDGNGFSGTKATQISNADLERTGTFTGEFSGNIFGDKGEEAAGVFDFDGGEAGAFRGAFGGTNQK